MRGTPRYVVVVDVAASQGRRAIARKVPRETATTHAPVEDTLMLPKRLARQTAGDCIQAVKISGPGVEKAARLTIANDPEAALWIRQIPVNRRIR